MYTIKDHLLVMVASDRISAFDVILPRLIPYKGQVLNQIAAYMLKATADICPNWLLDTPAPNVSIGKRCEPYRVEMVVTGKSNRSCLENLFLGADGSYAVFPCRKACGKMIIFPIPSLRHPQRQKPGMMKIFRKKKSSPAGLVNEKDYEPNGRIHPATFPARKRTGRKRGLILVDTKYEFGKIGDTIYLMDEIHTPDSSRYFYSDGFEERQQKGRKTKTTE